MIRPNPAARLASLLCACALCLASALPAVAQTAHEHDHPHAGAAVANLQLDAGHKWATDASLRSGMAQIRAAFDADHPAIHAGKETDAQYEALAARIESQVERHRQELQAAGSGRCQPALRDRGPAAGRESDAGQGSGAHAARWRSAGARGVDCATGSTSRIRRGSRTRPLHEK